MAEFVLARNYPPPNFLIPGTNYSSETGRNHLSKNLVFGQIMWPGNRRSAEDEFGVTIHLNGGLIPRLLIRLRQTYKPSRITRLRWLIRLGRKIRP